MAGELTPKERVRELERLPAITARYKKAIEAVLRGSKIGSAILSGDTIAEWNDSDVELTRALAELATSEPPGRRG